MDPFERDRLKPNQLPPFYQQIMYFASVVLGWYFTKTESTYQYSIQTLTLFVRILDGMAFGFITLAQWARGALDLVQKQGMEQRQVET